MISVELAPADAASVSLNTYSGFSVPGAGVELNNLGVNAATIVNEVTSSSITRIEGPLTVIGPEADVIVANPNGITVNGGQFFNTGNVALTTGSIGIDASGGLNATIASGSIDIGTAGLSGTMEELALISKTLRIDGPLTFYRADHASQLNVITGDSRVSFDRDRSGFGQDGSGILPWALATEVGSSNVSEVIVDITGAGSISSGRVSVTVTDQGAGVRIADSDFATSGGFRLTSSGQLELTNSHIEAGGSVAVSAGAVTISATELSGSSISSEESGVVIEAQDGDIDLGTSRIFGRIIASDSLASSGGVTLTASGSIYAGNGELGSAALISDAGILPNELDNSDVVLSAGEDVVFDGVEVAATNDWRVSASRSISLSTVGGSIGKDFRLNSGAATRIVSSALDAQSDIRLDASRLQFGSDIRSETRTTLTAFEGGVVLSALSGNILNYGSLLQGNARTESDADSLGGLTIRATGDFRNTSLSVDRLAVAFGEADDLFVSVGGDIVNETARLFSNRNVMLRSGGDVLNTTVVNGSGTPFAIRQLQGQRLASSLFLKRKRTTVAEAVYGQEAIAGERSFILGIGDVSIEANNVENTGADVSGATVSVTAANSFLNSSQQVGSFSFRQTCKLFCKTSGTSSLRMIGGAVNASQTLTLTAGSKISNVAGTLSGNIGIFINAPETVFIPAFSAALIEHPAGLTGFFRGRRGYLQTRLSYGSLRSINGSVRINGDANLGATDLFILGEVIVTGSRVESTLPTVQRVFERRPIGFFGSTF